MDWVKLAYPQLPVWFVPNGGHLTKTQRGKFMQMGLRPGVADLHHLLPVNGKLAVTELKAANGKLSDSQEVFRDDVLRQRGFWVECRTLEEYAECVTGWMIVWGHEPRCRILRSGALQRVGG